MNRQIPIFSLLTFLTVIGFSCCDDPPAAETGTFSLQFTPNFDSETWAPTDTYVNQDGRNVAFSDFKFYLSNITLIKEDGEEIELRSEDFDSEVFLVDLFQGTIDGDEDSHTFEVPVGNYTGLKLNVGVPEIYNGSDPATYDLDHPLGVRSGMHWSWNAGYMFVRIDGRVDSSATKSQPPTLSLIYHAGANGLFRSKAFQAGNDGFEIKSDEVLTYEFDVDVNKCFYNTTEAIDMAERNLTHTGGEGSTSYELAEEVMDNFVNEALTRAPF
ncbi:MbnP family protein [Pontibacter sp. G13]|uniref:MbnP family protein n=1 Tax=Pontibacter sp. G13 TaxID=3074898 RepID=UPI002889184E|nr:MbnP family protein [Pontibacter sp. G13]WNJ20128.1 hypothetical protein RJD25_06560 [Pontibacter sp. G13]